MSEWGSEDTLASNWSGNLTGADAPSAGELFAGRYRVLAEIGRGGMGVVMLAEDTELGDAVALKLLRLPGNDEQALARLRREVRLARRVTHRNIVRTFDIGEYQGARFVTMEYIRGEDLDAKIKRGRVAHAQALEVARQIATGLAAAHAVNVIHRDLKPANVLLEQGGRVVITDFGVARAVEGADATLQTGGIVGTPAYMAPEQISSGNVDARSDIYALGLILFRMLSGSLPFEGKTPVAAAFARVNNSPTELSSLVEVPADLDGLVMRCISREPEARPQSVSALMRELDALVATHGAGELTIRDVSLQSLRDGAEDGPTSTIYHGSDSSADNLTSSTRATKSSRSATTLTGKKSLAVLPFRYRGPDDERDLAEALHEELIDVLSLVDRLEVSGATTLTNTSLTPRDSGQFARDLDVDVLVDGTMQVSRQRVRISLRLTDAKTGVRLWNERFDAELDDPFEFQDRMSKRLGEALRANLEDIAHRDFISEEAYALYKRARRLEAKWDWRGPTGACPVFREVVEQAPVFKPARAGYASAAMRRWFITPADMQADHEREARQAVEDALDRAPEFAETRLAYAMVMVQDGDFRAAAAELEHALELAPTFAEVHEYLGVLQLDAGRPERAREHLELALWLRPSLVRCLGELGRHHALMGEFDRAIELTEAFVKHVKRSDTPATLQLMRIGAWSGDRSIIEQALHSLDAHADSAYVSAYKMVGHLLTTTPDNEEALGQTLAGLVSSATNPRLETFLLQLATEIALVHEFANLGLRYLERAASLVLVDLTWVDHCPLLASVRDDPRFGPIRATVRSRAEAIWDLHDS